MIEWLTTLGPLREAAMVARMFRLDPVGVLDDDGDDWAQLVRVAAARYVAREEEKAARDASKK